MTSSRLTEEKQAVADNFPWALQEKNRVSCKLSRRSKNTTQALLCFSRVPGDTCLVTPLFCSSTRQQKWVASFFPPVNEQEPPVNQLFFFVNRDDVIVNQLFPLVNRKSITVSQPFFFVNSA